MNGGHVQLLESTPHRQSPRTRRAPDAGSSPTVRRALTALLAAIALSLAAPALGHAEAVSNPNNYECNGHIEAGKSEPGGEETPVKYGFVCNGQITGYQLQTQLPITGIEGSPLLTNFAGAPMGDTFSCSGAFPGYAVNCVGASTSESYEKVTGQFEIGWKLCTEPRVDPLLTVTYAYSEKGVITQAISGPFDLGRPVGCPPSAGSGKDRLSAYQGSEPKHKGRQKGKKGKGSKGAKPKGKGRPGSHSHPGG
jgi:hypothetical protein